MTMVLVYLYHRYMEAERFFSRTHKVTQIEG